MEVWWRVRWRRNGTLHRREERRFQDRAAAVTPTQLSRPARQCSPAWHGACSVSLSMARATPMACRALVASVMAGCALAASPAKTPEKLLTPQERSALIRRAQIWTTTDVGAADVARGPDGGFAPGADVECSYEIVKFGGHTPKFGCALAPHDVVKVRYGRDNGEVYAGVAAT